jgi:hypothetical protein
MMNGYRESDSLIVSGKPVNKIGDNKPMAEKVEKRRLAKRNPSKRNRSQTQGWIILPNELERIRYAAWNACASTLEAGAQCISSARWDLYGGCRVTGIPTVNKTSLLR